MLRLLALAGQTLLLAVTVATVAWVLNSRLMRLVVRWAERVRPTRPWGIGALLVALALVYTGATFWLAREIYDLARDAPAWVGVDLAHGASTAWRWLLWLILALAVLVAARSSLGEALTEIAARRRLSQLVERRGGTRVAASPGTGAQSPAAPALPALPPGEGRRIVILCDGTSNRPDQTEDGEAAATNIHKLYRALGCDETQVTWYQAGIGSDTSSSADEVRRNQFLLETVGAGTGAKGMALLLRVRRIWESAFGAGISETIARGYAEIVRQYRPGDRIYLLGFSRGAYAARCIAGVISRCGLLRADNLRYAPDMVRIYRTRARQEDDAHVRAELCHPSPEIHFLGVFDTVASLGTPLWGWWYRAVPIWRNESLATDPAGACRHVYHALAMDERRAQFFPTLFDRPKDPAWPETLEQVWFRGAHADIGGGYARHDLSDIPLAWMMKAMERHGLRFQADARTGRRPDPLGRMHDELARKPQWRLFGTWPRWHPTPGEDGTGACAPPTTLHESVLARAARVEGTIGRPDLLRLAPGHHQDVTVEARRDWHRTGIVVERGAAYRVTWLGGRWRDKDAPLCGPAGQEAGRLDLRRFLGGGRRLPEEPWMRLVAAVAHPRRWALKEKRLDELLDALFVSDPPELRAQLAPIGRHLATEGAALLLHSEAPSGLLYLFANDWWQTADNNSGGPHLRIERVAAWDRTLPSWRLGPKGSWRAHRPGEPPPGWPPPG